MPHTTRKETDIGQIPQEWEVLKLDDIASIRSGTTRPQESGEYPVYGGNGILNYTNEYNMSGSIIVGRVGAYCGSVYFEENKYWLSDNALGLINKSNSDIAYLYYMLKNINLNTKAIGAAQPLLTQGILKEIELPLPPLPEQKAIASILGSLDNKIELLREQNKTLEAIGQTIFKEWFGKYGVDDELPEGWRVGKLGELDILKRIPVKYRCDKKDLSEIKKTPIIDQGITGLYGYTEREPDVIASEENPVAIFTNHTCNSRLISYPFCAIQNVLPFIGKNGYGTTFIHYMTKGKVTFQEYKGHWPDFEQKEYILPPTELAQKFENMILPLEKHIRNNEKQIQSLTKVRNSLLPRLMSGRVRV